MIRIILTALLVSISVKATTFTGYTSLCVNCVTPADSGGALQSGAFGTESTFNFSNSTFSGSTVANTLTFNDAAVFPNSQGTNNFGNLFTGLPGPGAGTLYVTVTFTAPSGASSLTFAGTFGSAGTPINFDNTPQLFTYAGGTFTLALQDVTLIPNGNEDRITGTIVDSPAAVPEPGAVSLVGSGLVALVLLNRRHGRWKQPS